MEIKNVDYYGALTAKATWGGVAGIISQNVVEKLVFSNARDIFGVAVPAPGQRVEFYPPKASSPFSPDTSKPADAMFGLKRQAFRAVTALGGIALTAMASDPLLKGVGAGITGVALANLVQDQFPALR